MMIYYYIVIIDNEIWLKGIFMISICFILIYIFAILAIKLHKKSIEWI